MLKGKVAVVTGSTSGIGLGIARALAGAGCDMMLNGFGDPGEIEELRAGIAADCGVAVRYSAADMGDPAAVAGLIADCESSLGACDILVNNAGIQHVAAVEEFPTDKWDAIMAINLSSNFHAIRAALPGMKARGWGRIVNIASAHGLIASPYKSAYVAAKHGAVGLTKVVALETAQSGITCNAICPGYVLTPLVEGQIDDQAKAHEMSRDQVVREIMLEAQPNKAFIEIDDLGAFVVFLCSDAAKGITGAALSVDGGFTAR